MKAAVIVAHPDDETLWCGGTILLHSEYEWTIIALTRKSDPDRCPKFYRILEMLHVDCAIGDLDDGPEQFPLSEKVIDETILNLLADRNYGIIITHSPFGEYTCHRRHEETAQSVIRLIGSGILVTRKLWLFAYTDSEKRHLPRAITSADEVINLPNDIWEKKYQIITELYGFETNSFEAKTTPKVEAFWSVRTDKPELLDINKIKEMIVESSGDV
ncbi:PIG-L deacetylase family protein [Candidatus Latescibacterota bacterium]